MSFQLVQATENRLLEPICTFRHLNTYSVYLSEEFPVYYGGNGIEILDASGRSLPDWEVIFGEHFDPAIYEHFTFTFPDLPPFRHLIEQAKADDYHVEVCSYMLASTTDQCRGTPPEWEIHQVVDEEDWERFRVFYDESSRGYDWYDEEYGTESLFNKTRATSEALGIDWFYISQAGKKEMLAKAGIFQHAGVCRLQDVMTGQAWRRKGLASFLVSFLIKRALQDLNATGVALIADVDYVAIDLYRNLGFVDCGNSVCLMKYPLPSS